MSVCLSAWRAAADCRIRRVQVEQMSEFEFCITDQSSCPYLHYMWQESLSSLLELHELL